MLIKVLIVGWFVIFIIGAALVDTLDRIREEKHRREMNKIFNNFDDLVKDVEKTLKIKKKKR